jgi:peptidoglycan/LPS O-acetylase OafA/YrhL
MMPQPTFVNEQMIEASANRYDDGRARTRDRELDGLRGLAILLVIFQHYVVGPFKPAAGTVAYYFLIPGRLAWTGVDLFFVLSGFLVGRLLMQNRESITYFKTFFIRRACRILPLYLAVVAAAALFDPGFVSNDHLPLYAYLTFTQNFWMAAAASLGVMSLAVTWSLAIEEQFYVTLPFLVRFVSPARLWRIIVACIVLAPLFRLLTDVTVSNGYFASHVLFFNRMDTLMLGVLAAWLHQKRARLPRSWLYTALFVLMAILLLFAWKGQSANLLVRVFLYDAVAMFYCSMLLLAMQGGLRFLRSRALAYTGTISYALYLLHRPLQEIVHGGDRAITGWRDVAVTAAALVIVFVLASLSWELFERKFVNFGHRFRYEHPPSKSLQPLDDDAAVSSSSFSFDSASHLR